MTAAAPPCADRADVRRPFVWLAPCSDFPIRAAGATAASLPGAGALSTAMRPFGAHADARGAAGRQPWSAEC